MHCPRCGTNATSSQQFCRSCGLSLEKVAEILGEEVAMQASPLPNQITALRERQQKFENWAGIAGLTTFGLVLLLLIIVVFSQMILKGGLLIIPGTLLILLAVGAGAMGIFQAYSKSLKAKLGGQPLPPSHQPPPFQTSELLNQPLASVTEHTTKLLHESPDGPAD